MKFSGTKVQSLHKALLSAFPTKSYLEQMIRFQLDENLDTIADGTDHSERVFNLIRWAETKGKLDELINGAIKANPSNPLLNASADAHLHQLRGHSEKWWEIRANAYQTLIEALSDLVHFYECHYNAEIENRELNDSSQKKLSKLLDDSYPIVRKSADSGTLLFSDEVNEALMTFIKCSKDDYDSVLEDLDAHLYEAKNCLETVVAASIRDLKV